MRLDIQPLKEGLLRQLPGVIEALYGKRARWQTHEWRTGDVQGTEGSSLAIEGRDPARLGLWIDYANDEQGDIFKLIQGALGTDFKGALAWAQDFLGPGFRKQPVAPVPKKKVAPQTGEGKPLEPMLPRSLSSASKALKQSPKAMEYLYGRGLKQETIEHFHLGLSTYDKGDSPFKDALSFPLMDAAGIPRKRWLRYKIPGLTEGGPPKSTGWASGSAGVYWLTPMEGRTSIFVCEGAKDGWWLWQAIQGTLLADTLCIISSTHGSVIPVDWKDVTFWQGWEHVYLGQDADEAGDTMARKLRESAGRDVQRIRIPEGKGKDWTDFFKGGGTPAEFQQLLHSAGVFDVEVRILEEPTLPHQVGLHAATPVDVNSAFVNGHLYQPFRVLERQVEEQQAADGTKTEVVLQRYRTLVLRSDGVACTFDYLPAPRGTPKEDLVLALSDGTIIQKVPVVDEAKATFSLAGITRLREASRNGTSAMTMTSEDMLSKVEQHLRAAVVLPYQEDYAVLTYVVVVSYAQQIFDAVPLILVVGSAGSGKTDLGRALANVSCNSSIITGQTSAATAARVLDQLNGLAVFDDLEEIGSRSADGEFSEFIQQLKVSYKKDTATKSWTNTKSMKVEKLNFYGVKVITNTQGADGILSTRMLRVYTRKLPKDALEGLMRHTLLTTLELQELRDNLHIWVMENVSRIDHQYRTFHASHSDRQEEITAPLRVLSELLPHPKLSEQLLTALKMKESEPVAEMSPVDLLREAVKSLIQQGYWDRISVKQLMLEMRLMVGEDWGRKSTTEIMDWQEPRWVGRTLRAEQIVDPHSKDDRPRLWGEQTRIVALEKAFVAETLTEFDEKGIEHAVAMKQPLEFCLPRPCEECPYATLCEMRPIKERKNGGKGVNA